MWNSLRYSRPRAMKAMESAVNQSCCVRLPVSVSCRMTPSRSTFGIWIDEILNSMAASLQSSSELRLRLRVNAPLHRPAAIDQMDMAADECGFVGRQIDGQHGDLFGGADPPHRLAVDEILFRSPGRNAGAVGVRRDAIAERRRFDRARADRVDAQPLLDEIRRGRLGQPDHSRLGEAVDIAVGNAPDRR